MLSKKTVMVLMGGWSPEREVSLSSGQGVVNALKDSAYDVIPYDIQSNDLGAFIQKLSPKPDVIFNALHGPWGEDGGVQAILDVLDIPYTHSGVRASAIAMHKKASKRAFVAEGIPVANDAVLAVDTLKTKGIDWPKPYVIKPIDQGSSVGVYIIKDDTPVDLSTWTYGPYAMIEDFIPGRELSVAVMNGKALGTIELRPRTDFYDYTAKYTDGVTEHLCPAPIPPADEQKIMHYAELAHQALGCTGVTRADFRYDDTDPKNPRIILLEINTQPGLTPLSLVPEIAAHKGISYRDLLEWMIEDAQCRR